MERVQDKQGFRWYVTEFGALPSVTSILSVYPKGKAFERWLGESDSYDAAIAKRDAAGDRGSLVHDCIASLLVGQVVTLPGDTDPKVLKYIEGFLNWWGDWKPTLVKSEFMVVHPSGWAGTVDLLIKHMGALYVVDVKTSSAVYTSYHLQTAAYAAAVAAENLTIDMPLRGILHLKTSTKKGYQFVESPCSQTEDLQAFLACRVIFHREYGYEPELPDEKEPPTLTFKLEV